MQVLIWFGHPSVCVDAREILVMADDVATLESSSCTNITGRA
jgi:hypothetical protein